MGWLKQNVDRTSAWLRQVGKDVSDGFSWLHENVIRPTVHIAKQIPEFAPHASEIGDLLDTVESVNKKVRQKGAQGVERSDIEKIQKTGGKLGKRAREYAEQRGMKKSRT